MYRENHLGFGKKPTKPRRSYVCLSQKIFSVPNPETGCLPVDTIKVSEERGSVKMSKKKKENGGWDFTKDLRSDCFPGDSEQWNKLLKMAARVSPTFLYVMACTRAAGAVLTEQKGRTVLRPVLRGQCPTPDCPGLPGGCAFPTQEEYDRWRKEYLTFYKDEIQRLLRQVEKEGAGC